MGVYKALITHDIGESIILPRDTNDDDSTRPESVPHDPGPSVLASVPDVLQDKLREYIIESENNKE